MDSTGMDHNLRPRSAPVIVERQATPGALEPVLMPCNRSTCGTKNGQDSSLFLLWQRVNVAMWYPLVN